jgi:hypothetical protein
VNAYWKAVQMWLADTRPARQVTEALLHTYSRRHLAWFDQLAPARCQTRTLLGLLHQAQSTRFGLDHDFRRIRTVADYRRLVPLCASADLWRAYWQPAFPHLDGATWPGPGPGPVAPAPPGEERRPAVALSAALQAAHQAAFRTALALTACARPRARLLAGTLLFLGDDALSAAPAGEALLSERLPALVRPYALAALAGSDDNRSALAERAARVALTCLAGPAERLLPFLRQVKQVCGADRLAEVWPGLTAVLYTRRSHPAAHSHPAVYAAGSPGGAQLRAEVGGGALLLETAFRPEGPIAVEDPRHGGLRLLPDHGVFFEFVPFEEAGKPNATRHSLDEVEMGVPYELALTSPAGLWACRVGTLVSFEGRQPPLLRFLEAPVPQPAPAVKREARAPAFQEPPPHRQSGGSPAALPGSFAHTPWSAPGGRG